MKGTPALIFEAPYLVQAALALDENAAPLRTCSWRITDSEGMRAKDHQAVQCDHCRAWHRPSLPMREG